MRKLSGGGDYYFMQNDEFYYWFLSTPPHCVVLTPVPGGESGCSVIAGHCGYNFTATADCPPETGGTRSEATEGVDKISKNVK